MKKFITLLLLSVFSVGALTAQDMQRQRYQQTKLTVSSFYNYPLQIIVDGNTYTYDNARNNNNEFQLSNLSVGNHRIQIYRKQQRGRRAPVTGNNLPGLIYDATLYLRPQYQTDIVINRFGRAFKDEMLINEYEGPNNPGYPSGYPQTYNREMSAENFAALKATVTNDSYENSRLNIVKQAAVANYFTSLQVKQLLQVFSYENTKLDIAKLLYARTVDKGNYFMVNDAFSYSNSKTELAEFIRLNP